MIKDEKAQMGIDFVVGVSIFLLALGFVGYSISGMFLPFQTETIDLNSVTYRTSVILVEDPGCWNGGEDWENQNIENINRVGLAIDKEHPNMLALHKINSFKNKSLMNDNNLADKLGLYREIGDNKIYYGYNITITGLNGGIIAKRGNSVPEYGDVSSMSRIVNAQTDSVYDLMGLKSIFPHQDDKADFSISTPENDLRLVICDIVVQNPSNKSQINYIKINNQSKIELGEDYWVWIDSGTGEFEPQSVSPIDLPENTYSLKIVIDKNVFVDEEARFGNGKHLIEIKFVGVIAEIGIADLDDIGETIISEPAILKLNIWS